MPRDIGGGNHGDLVEGVQEVAGKEGLERVVFCQWDDLWVVVMWKVELWSLSEAKIWRIYGGYGTNFLERICNFEGVFRVYGKLQEL
jgi:hypothetical protein